MFARSWSNAHVKKLFIVIMFLRQRSIVEDRQSKLRQRSKVEDREYAFMKKDNDRIIFPILDIWFDTITTDVSRAILVNYWFLCD